ncbi:MAG: hypothetical protein MJ102_01670 [Clostridia bacterium]|nr:hypothetical protein [Clostridia bacterium]
MSVKNSDPSKKVKNRGKKSRDIPLALICSGVILAALLIVLSLVFYPRIRAASELGKYSDKIVDSSETVIISDLTGSALNSEGDAEVLFNGDDALRIAGKISDIIDKCSYSVKSNTEGGSFDIRLLFTLLGGEKISIYVTSNGEQLYFTRGKTRFYFDVPGGGLADTIRSFCK